MTSPDDDSTGPMGDPIMVPEPEPEPQVSGFSPEPETVPVATPIGPLPDDLTAAHEAIATLTKQLETMAVQNHILLRAQDGDAPGMPVPEPDTRGGSRSLVTKLKAQLVAALAAQRAAEQALGQAREVRAVFEQRSVYMITPAHRRHQGPDTRIYVLADGPGDAIRRLVSTGRFQEADIANVTQTSQKIVLGDD